MPVLDYRLIGAVIVALALFAAGWFVNGWRLSGELQREKAAYATNLKKLSDAALDQSNKLQAQRDDDLRRIDAIAANYEQEINNAKSENDKLRADLASGARVLYVNAKCPAAGNSMPSAGTDPARAATETRAELDRTTAQQLVGITSDGDAVIKQLNSLIDACVSGH